MAGEISFYVGKLKDGRELVNYLKLDEKVSRLTGKLAVYAHLRKDEDTANPTYQALAIKYLVCLQMQI